MLDCNDATLIVNGTSNIVTAKGNCWAVTVMGSSNTVVADSVVARHHRLRLRPDGVLPQRRPDHLGPRPRTGHDQPTPAGRPLSRLDLTNYHQRNRGTCAPVRLTTRPGWPLSPRRWPLRGGCRAGRLQFDRQPAGRRSTTSATTTTTAPTSTSAAATTTSGGNSANTSVEIGNTVNYGSFGTTATVDCADGKSLNVAGSNNTLTVTGTCADGEHRRHGQQDHHRQGRHPHHACWASNNTITYKDGDPKVDNIGTEQHHQEGQLIR